jgi:hypothetical protein
MRVDGPGCPQVRGRCACGRAQRAKRHPATGAGPIPA